MQIELFDDGKRLGKLSELGDSLVQLNNIINWEMFRPILNEVFRKEHKGVGCRPPYDYVVLFKTLVLQRVYNLSDEMPEMR